VVSPHDVIDVRPANSVPTDELAALFTRGYEGYIVPMQLDEETLRFMAATFDIDLAASRVAFRNGDPVGIANLGVRGARGWIGGLGVVPEARRHGIGRTLMEALHEEAGSRGMRELRLEVIEGNDAALGLYETLGYEFLRWLEIGSLEAAPAPEGGGAEECAWLEAHARIRELRTEAEPWQRADETLARYEGLRGLATEGGAAVFRIDREGRAVLMQVAGNDSAAHRLMERLRGLGAVSLFNVPEDDPAAVAFRSLGGKVTLRQREMILRL
jgi:GNAT superfamily N-acetyltransferase